MDIRIDLHDITPPKLASALAEYLPAGWRRDGILESQVSTQEDVQYAFRNEPGKGGDRPRAALVLAGPAETLTVAVVTPIDRDGELSDAQYDAMVEEFWRKVVEPAVAGLDGVSARLVRDSHH